MLERKIARAASEMDRSFMLTVEDREIAPPLFLMMDIELWLCKVEMENEVARQQRDRFK